MASNPINRLKNQVNSLEYKLMKKQETIDKMNELLKVDEHQRKTLLNDANRLQAFKNENNELKYKNNKLMEDYSNLLEQNKKLVDDVDWLDQDYGWLKDQHEQLKSKNKKLRIILEDSKKYKFIDCFRLFLELIGLVVFLAFWLGYFLFQVNEKRLIDSP